MTIIISAEERLPGRCWWHFGCYGYGRLSWNWKTHWLVWWLSSSHLWRRKWRVPNNLQGAFDQIIVFGVVLIGKFTNIHLYFVYDCWLHQNRLALHFSYVLFSMFLDWHWFQGWRSWAAYKVFQGSHNWKTKELLSLCQ